MGKRFYTADWHLGSTNILKYAHRPFASAGIAALNLVGNCNEAAEKQDAVFHVGDFWLKGKDRHDDAEDENRLTASVDDYIRFVSARLVLLEGNHDASNVETDLKSMCINLNQNYVNVTVAHYPSYHEQYNYIGNGNRNSLSRGFLNRAGREGKNLHIHLCGHVHQKWKYYYDAKKNVLNYNVGCDCHGYKPVEDATITQDLDFLTARHDFKNDWTMTVQDEIEWKKAVNSKIAEAREQRKQERYLKKGLTKEECARRRNAAMRAKGLI